MSDSDSELAAPPEEGFISRWSRRKHVARADSADTAAEPLAAEASGEDAADVSAETAVVEEYLPDDSDMPPLESLDEESDYTGFMSPKVSDELRNLALRKLFLSGMFSSRDGLDDYDDDFTRFEKLGDVITAEMRHQMERVKEAVDDSEASGEEIIDENDASLPEAGMEDDAETDPDMSIAVADKGTALSRENDIRPASDNEQYVEDHKVDEDS